MKESIAMSIVNKHGIKDLDKLKRSASQKRNRKKTKRTLSMMILN